MIGVYRIYIGNYFYHGSSEDCEKRCIKQHLKELLKGSHRNKKMQNAFNKHKTFEWEVVEECDDRDVSYAVEQRYIDVNLKNKYSLNLNRSASKPPSGLRRGMKCSEEHKQKISQSKKGSKYLNRKSPTIIRQKCIYCGNDYAPKDITRFHNEKCKEKV